MGRLAAPSASRAFFLILLFHRLLHGHDALYFCGDTRNEGFDKPLDLFTAWRILALAATVSKHAALVACKLEALRHS